jgi:cell division protein FtsB
MELRKQVSGELKLRRYILNTILILSLIYVFGSIIFSDMGILRYLEIQDNHEALARELNHIETQNDQISKSLRNYKTDTFYIEKYARENYGMSKPEELIFIYKE